MAEACAANEVAKAKRSTWEPHYHLIRKLENECRATGNIIGYEVRLVMGYGGGLRYVLTTRTVTSELKNIAHRVKVLKWDDYYDLIRDMEKQATLCPDLLSYTVKIEIGINQELFSLVVLAETIPLSRKPGNPLVIRKQ